LEFNSKVFKQNRQAQSYSVGNLIGEIGVKELKDFKSTPFKTATVGDLEITQNSAGKQFETFCNAS
jgi:hypothetical protein